MSVPRWVLASPGQSLSAGCPRLLQQGASAPWALGSSVSGASAGFCQPCPCLVLVGGQGQQSPHPGHPPTLLLPWSSPSLGCSRRGLFAGKERGSRKPLGADTRGDTEPLKQHSLSLLPAPISVWGCPASKGMLAETEPLLSQTNMAIRGYTMGVLGAESAWGVLGPGGC